MKLLILLLFPLLLGAQRYNQDTTWVLNYIQLNKLRVEIETSKQQRQILTKELELMYEKSGEQSKIVKKLQVRDSLYTLELEKAAEIETIFREKLGLYNTIVGNYKILLFGTEEQLKAAEKKRRREKLWKNIYRYSYPAVGAVVIGILIFK